MQAYVQEALIQGKITRGTGEHNTYVLSLVPSESTL